MKTIYKFLILCLASLSVVGCSHRQKASVTNEQDSVTISGQVTDYDGTPIDSCDVIWQSPSFDSALRVKTDSKGHYEARIPKGKYQSMAAIHLPSYPNVAMQEGKLKEKDYRLEFWAWDFIADRDTTLNIRYHRMEVYGLRVFRIPGAMPCYQIYVRPMSLTRALAEMTKEKKEGECQMSPHSEQLGVKVQIDGEEVPVLMKQEIKEYLSENEYANAYLLTVDMPKQPNTDLPYRIFKVELTDLENGDQGEGIYYMEKEKYKE